MPEGDTIFRTAVTLRKVLEGRPVIRAAAPDPQLLPETLVGRTVAAIEARGKHLLVHFDDRRAIHSHLAMTGSWHIYRPGERWQKPQRLAKLTLEVAPDPESPGHSVAVCFTPGTLELLTETALRRHAWLSKLGPDILSRAFDADEVLRRFQTQPTVPVGEALLKQSIVCGIGNVYKSESLFLTGINPFRNVADVPLEALRDLIETNRQLMLRNLEGFPRTTRFAGDAERAWVYARQGEPCFNCGTAIQMRRQGDLGRSTYWCPACQTDG